MRTKADLHKLCERGGSVADASPWLPARSGGSRRAPKLLVAPRARPQPDLRWSPRIGVLSAPVTPKVKTRRFRAEDSAFVEDMILSACFPPTRARPTVDEARLFPHAARWLAPPIGTSDIAVVAEAEGIGPIAAAVGRRFEKADPSWGVVSPDVPELALAVASEHRGKRVGEALLRAWLEELRASGFTSASLTVSLHNEHASRLYARGGFREVMRDERRVLMSLPVPEEGRHPRSGVET